MNYAEAKHEFIQEWGILGSSWGINKTEAQIHALLLLSPEPLAVEEIMEELHVSRGNVSMSLRSLMDWGIVYKKFKPNERKEYFISEKDIWELATQVAQERQKRELKPVLRMLENVQQMQDSSAAASDVDTFQTVTSELSKFANQCNKVLNGFVRADKSWFFSKLLRIFR